MSARRRTIRDAAQLRLLADTKKFRIVEALRDAPASPHELAKRLGTKPTALYHHVARLAAAGIIEPAERRRRRGVIETRYRPVARQLIVDRALLRGPGRSRSVAAVLAVASTIVDVTIADIRAAAHDRSRPLADRDRSEVATIAARVTPRGARELMRKLRALLEAAARLDRGGTEQVRLTLAIVPISQPARRGARS
jgi:DNA-binding transcriptional ArsR family regulator